MLTTITIDNHYLFVPIKLCFRWGHNEPAKLSGISFLAWFQISQLRTFVPVSTRQEWQSISCERVEDNLKTFLGSFCSQSVEHQKSNKPPSYPQNSSFSPCRSYLDANQHSWSNHRHSSTLTFMSGSLKVCSSLLMLHERVLISLAGDSKALRRLRSHQDT
jgi:hypothetical protein